MTPEDIIYNNPQYHTEVPADQQVSERRYETDLLEQGLRVADFALLSEDEKDMLYLLNYLFYLEQP